MSTNLIRFVRTVALPASAQAVFDWHEAPGAFNRLTPPREPVQVISHTGGIRDGARVCLRVGPWPFRLRWDLEHVDYQPGRSFTDRQVRGPFRSWTHVHRIVPTGPDSCVLEDAIEYEMRGGAVGKWLGVLLMQPKLERLFGYRHAVTRRAFEAAS